MVTLNRIYTRTGDGGTTALGSGERVPKFDLRIEAYGTVDETNAAIGVARLDLGADAPPVPGMLARIQNDLFDLGADLCVPERPAAAAANEKAAKAPKQERLRIVASQTGRLEQEIDELNAHLSPLKSFVLPGGTRAAAQLHVARTVCRRAERLICALAAQPGESVGADALKYVNRLSDLLFVASRFVNDGGRGDVLWVPGQNR
jgi:cob(I)alamin adenosyltransferase